MALLAPRVSQQYRVLSSRWVRYVLLSPDVVGTSHFSPPSGIRCGVNYLLQMLVDFHRIPGVTREFLLEHVRAGEEVFTQEIIDAGFELINAHYVPFLEENYVLRFRKP